MGELEFNPAGIQPVAHHHGNTAPGRHKILLNGKDHLQSPDADSLESQSSGALCLLDAFIKVIAID